MGVGLVLSRPAQRVGRARRLRRGVLHVQRGHGPVLARPLRRVGCGICRRRRGHPRPGREHRPPSVPHDGGPPSLGPALHDAHDEGLAEGRPAARSRRARGADGDRRRPDRPRPARHRGRTPRLADRRHRGDRGNGARARAGRRRQWPPAGDRARRAGGDVRAAARAVPGAPGRRPCPAGSSGCRSPSARWPARSPSPSTSASTARARSPSSSTRGRGSRPSTPVSAGVSTCPLPARPVSSPASAAPVPLDRLPSAPGRSTECAWRRSS